jgi:hypothetical protein
MTQLPTGQKECKITRTFCPIQFMHQLVQNIVLKKKKIDGSQRGKTVRIRSFVSAGLIRVWVVIFEKIIYTII